MKVYITLKPSGYNSICVDKAFYSWEKARQYVIDTYLKYANEQDLIRRAEEISNTIEEVEIE